MQACGRTVLVKADEVKEQTTPCGIVLPESCNDLFKGTVVSVGAGTSNNDVIPCEVGDRVTFRDFEEIKIISDGEELLVVQFSDIICRE